MKKSVFDGLLDVVSLYSVIHVEIYVAIHAHHSIFVMIQNFVVAVRAHLLE